MTLRHRLLPSPMTSAALLLAWLMLNESASPGQWLLGALLAIGLFYGYAKWRRSGKKSFPILKRLMRLRRANRDRKE